jgi:hypothetical protein
VFKVTWPLSIVFGGISVVLFTFAHLSMNWFVSLLVLFGLLVGFVRYLLQRGIEK